MSHLDIFRVVPKDNWESAEGQIRHKGSSHCRTRQRLLSERNGRAKLNRVDEEDTPRSRNEEVFKQTQSHRSGPASAHGGSRVASERGDDVGSLHSFKQGGSHRSGPTSSHGGGSGLAPERPNDVGSRHSFKQRESPGSGLAKSHGGARSDSVRRADVESQLDALHFETCPSEISKKARTAVTSGGSHVTKQDGKMAYVRCRTKHGAEDRARQHMRSQDKSLSDYLSLRRMLWMVDRHR